MHDDSVFECARAIRAQLPRLLNPLDGARRDEIDRRLAWALARHAEPGAADDILDILWSVPELRTWAAGFLETGAPPRYAERGGYQRLPGSGEAVPAERFDCPEGDFVWYRAFLDERVPRCPTHATPLVRQDTPPC